MESVRGAIAAWAGEDNQAFEKIERGRYLAVVGDCVSCHTAPGGAPFAGGAGDCHQHKHGAAQRPLP
jgi:mono/diheme cytochrome c family protein